MGRRSDWIRTLPLKVFLKAFPVGCMCVMNKVMVDFTVQNRTSLRVIWPAICNYMRQKLQTGVVLCNLDIF